LREQSYLLVDRGWWVGKKCPQLEDRQKWESSQSVCLPPAGWKSSLLLAVLALLWSKHPIRSPQNHHVASAPSPLIIPLAWNQPTATTAAAETNRWQTWQQAVSPKLILGSEE
jgi:hypothetical protein